MKHLTLKDYAIINAFPYNITDKTVINIGCGPARIDWWLSKIGYKVYACDLYSDPSWEKQHSKNLYYYKDINILNPLSLSKLPSKAPIIICSEVLEHLDNYQLAFKHLILMATQKLIITVPFERSFNVQTGPSPHINFWSNSQSSEFCDIREFETFASPHDVKISKIITKEKDFKTRKRAYLVEVSINNKL